MTLRGVRRPSAAFNLVCDGNSLMSGAGVTTNTPQRVMGMAPMLGSGATMTNVGVPGQSWQGMIDGGAANVDPLWQSGKTNALLLWETTNQVNTKTAAEMVALCTSYIAARKALHPWTIILMTALPKGGAADVTIREWNASVSAKHRAMGATLLVDVRRVGSPFAFNGEVDGGFQRTQSLWQESSAWVHLTDAGHAIVAPMVAEALRRVPCRTT